MGYFWFLLPFYTLDYYVPDYFLYWHYGHINVPAADAFSSLFFDLSRWILPFPKWAYILALSCLTGSIFIIVSSFRQWLARVAADDYWAYLFLSATFTFGIWFYFYGKLFYEFPFTAITFSLALAAVVGGSTKGRPLSGKWWGLFFFFCGFGFSWKTYNIFLFLGMLGLVGIVSWRTFVADFKRNMGWAAVGCIFGYLGGNYHLLNEPIQALHGIRGYGVGASMIRLHHFFLAAPRFSWVQICDHVGSPPFSIGVIPLVSVAMLWAVSAIVGWSYFFLLGGLSLVYVVYIWGFSPGYLWHGFPVGLFLVLFYGFLLVESSQLSKLKQRGVVVLSIILISVAGVNNFGYYIPTQVGLAWSTAQAISIIEQRSGEIFDKVALENRASTASTMILVSRAKSGFVGVGGAMSWDDPSIKDPLLVGDRRWGDVRRIYFAGDKVSDVIVIVPRYFRGDTGSAVQMFWSDYLKSQLEPVQKSHRFVKVIESNADYEITRYY